MPRAAVLLLIAAGGCAARAPAPNPSSVLAAWSSAIAHDDARAAWRLLSRDQRARMPEDEFLVRWRNTVEERQSQAARFKAASNFTEHAKITAGDGSTAALALEAGQWRPTAARATEPGASTPEEALGRFLHALEQRNFDALLGLLSDPLRGLVERELSERVQHLKQALGQPVAVDGDVARVHYEPRFHVDLKRENGVWRVADFN